MVGCGSWSLSRWPRCAVRTTPYRAPETRPAALANADPALVVQQPYDPRWWRQFDDPVLDSSRPRALQANHDVRVAVARVDQARAVFDEWRCDRYPTVTVGASVDRREQVDARLHRRADARPPPTAPASTRSGRSTCSAGSGPPIACGVGDGRGFEATLDDVRVSVAAEVARNYFELRGLQQQLAVAERSLANQRETLRLTTVRRDAGIGEEQDVASAAARVAAIEASVPPLRAAAAARVHRLAVLTGVRPGELTVDLAPRPYPPLAKALPLGDPGQLLHRRPDVRAAERRLAAATAARAIAAAELYPRVTISGFLGLLAGRGSLFGNVRLARLGGDAGAAAGSGSISAARARGCAARRPARAKSLAEYEQTVLRALEETENALVAYREEQERLVKLADQARESARAAAIARARYREGVADFLALLDAERTQLQAEDAVAQAESSNFTA